MIGRGEDLGLPASLQRAEAVGAIPLLGFVFTPPAVFGHEVHTTEPNATQNDYYQDDCAAHTRYPISERETSITTVSGRWSNPTIHQVERLSARFWGIAFRVVLCVSSTEA